jgi:hypothetical protein
MANEQRDLDNRTRAPRSEATEKAPPAPGALASPQHPGMRPDRSTVPGYFSTTVPAARTVRRPLTQYGTAEAVTRVFSQKPPGEMTPEDFEQAPASFEELRKADLTALPPKRPQPRAIPNPDGTAALVAGEALTE